MDHPLATRFLLGMATVLFVTGCTMGAAGLHPSVQRPALSRLGMLLALASTPGFMVGTSWRAQQNIEGRLADAHMAGYQMCLDQLAQDPAEPAGMVRVPAQRIRSTYARKRGL